MEFTSTSFSGSESSGEILITLTLSGISTSDIDVLININEINATGHYELSVAVANNSVCNS